MALGTSKVSGGPSKDHLKELVSKKLSRKYFCLKVKPFLGSFSLIFFFLPNTTYSKLSKKKKAKERKTELGGWGKPDKIRLLNI